MAVSRNMSKGLDETLSPLEHIQRLMEQYQITADEVLHGTHTHTQSKHMAYVYVYVDTCHVS